MKKILKKIAILAFFTVAIAFTPSPVLAVDCPCITSGSFDAGGTSFDCISPQSSNSSCGAGWECDCSGSNSSPISGCIPDGDDISECYSCSNGTCFAAAPPPASGCNPGDTVQWVTEESQCTEPSHLGNSRSLNNMWTDYACCTPHEAPMSSNSTPEFKICEKLTGDAQTACINCGEGSVWTALGCISFSPNEFVADFMQIALGIAGGIALLLMVYGSFLISTSAGDPKKSETGKEVITGTIAGLLFIIFSVFLLKLIGVDILQIPGF